MELNKRTAQHAAQKHRVFLGDFEEIDFKQQLFDVVVMEQTLEHMGNPLQVLQKACTLLKKGGFIYIDVPRIDWMVLASDYFLNSKGNSGELWSPEDHLYYYSPRALHALLTTAGFQPQILPRNTLKSSIKSWLPPHEDEPLTPEKIKQVRERVISALNFLGIKYYVPA